MSTPPVMDTLPPASNFVALVFTKKNRDCFPGPIAVVKMKPTAVCPPRLAVAGAICPSPSVLKSTSVLMPVGKWRRTTESMAGGSPPAGPAPAEAVSLVMR